MHNVLFGRRIRTHVEGCALNVDWWSTPHGTIQVSTCQPHPQHRVPPTSGIRSSHPTSERADTRDGRLAVTGVPILSNKAVEVDHACAIDVLYELAEGHLWSTTLCGDGRQKVCVCVFVSVANGTTTGL